MGQLVHVETPTGPVYGYLFNAPFATGVVVVFSGLGMPAGGWINERFAEVGARRHFLTFAQVRDETARPIYFDPLREARRAIEAARQIVQTCRVAAPGDIRFVGTPWAGWRLCLRTERRCNGGWLHERASSILFSMRTGCPKPRQLLAPNWGPSG